MRYEMLRQEYRVSQAQRTMGTWRSHVLPSHWCPSGWWGESSQRREIPESSFKDLKQWAELAFAAGKKGQLRQSKYLGQSFGGDRERGIPGENKHVSEPRKRRKGGKGGGPRCRQEFSVACYSVWTCPDSFLSLKWGCEDLDAAWLSRAPGCGTSFPNGCQQDLEHIPRFLVPQPEDYLRISQRTYQTT